MVKIRQLVRGISPLLIRGNRELEIRGLASDSRKVAPGDLFIARKGEKYDGSNYIKEAIEAGAVAILNDIYDPFVKATQLISGNPGQLEAKLAANFYSHPSKELSVIGITSSKGKTTTAHLIRHLLQGLGIPCGLLSTVETSVGEEKFASKFTTHEPIFNQKILREMVSRQSKVSVMEVSSHGLALGRTDEIAFEVGVFTNLFPDHLDFHGTVDAYAHAKKLLFSRLEKKGIYNSDSEWSSFMMNECKAPLFSFGIEKKADLMARDLLFSPEGTRFLIGHSLVRTPLIGRYNVYNLLAAASVGLHFGASLDTITSILSSFTHVPGRLERVPNQRGFQVFVDYAHTGEALSNVLSSLRSVAKGKILVVFGCGGDRDLNRRPQMGGAAEQYADLSILTSDNPRSEPPEEIIRQILKGFKEPQKALIEPDRKKAIELAIQKAGRGDLVLIAGKGHEKTQIFAHQTIPFDDVVIAKEALF